MLSSVTVPQATGKPKERCKYFPNCTKGDTCEFIHPSTPCKSFPNCKFGDMCLYLHPKCKFDLTCSRLDCNFSHTPVISAAPPLGMYIHIYVAKVANNQGNFALFLCLINENAFLFSPKISQISLYLLVNH